MKNNKSFAKEENHENQHNKNQIQKPKEISKNNIRLAIWRKNKRDTQ